MLPFKDYALPTGSSPLHPYFPFKARAIDRGVFSSVRIANTADVMWTRVLTSTGASVVVSDKATLLLSLQGRTKSHGRVALPPDYIVVDPVASIGDETVSEIVSYCRNNTGSSPVIVTVDWVFYCMQTGEVVDPGLSKVFGLCEDTTHPMVHIVENDKRRERYVVGDIVYFKARDKDRAIGRISEFTKTSRGSRMEAVISALCSELKGKRRVLGRSEEQALCCVDVSCLEGRPVVLQSTRYDELEYAKGDVGVFACDVEWERQEAEALEEQASQGVADDRVMCFSQDF
jgi:hypothetical protein